MAIQVKLYKNNSLDIKCGKDLTPVGEYDAILKSDCSMSDPVILINGTTFADSLDFNYCRIIYDTDHRKCFFVKNIRYLTGRQCEIQCHIDVLETYKDDIIGSNQIMERSQKWSKDYLVDGQLPIGSDCVYDWKVFGEPVFSKDIDRVVLTTVGRGSLATEGGV